MSLATRLERLEKHSDVNRLNFSELLHEARIRFLEADENVPMENTDERARLLRKRLKEAGVLR